VTSPSDLILLDTSILVHLVRDNAIGQVIASRFSLFSRSERPIISVITIGEALALARRLGWGPTKVRRLELLLREFLIVDINSERVLRIYAEIDTHLKQVGKPIQHNDIWIAATAIAAKAHLVTTDTDFDSLHPRYVQRTWIDPRGPGLG
jgi:tRNA(fMet)-specific endonuclease VapC